MTIEVMERIGAVDAQEWDELCAGRPFADHRWLRLAESVLLGYEPRYILLRRAGRLEAAAVCALRRRFHHPALQRRAVYLLRRHPCLHCAIPISYDPGLLLRSGCDEAAPALLRALDTLARHERALFVKVDHLPSADAIWPVLGRAGYHPTGAWTDTTLPLSSASFEQYRADLPRRKRHQIGRIERQAEREGLTIERLDRAAYDDPLPRRLIENVLRRHQAQETYAPDLLARAGQIMGDDLVVLGARRDARLVGCAALLRSGDEVAAKWLGLDYTQTWNTATYHRLVVACVAQAIAMGARRLRTGATAYETKQHLGVVQEQRGGALALRNALLNRLAGVTFSIVERRPSRDLDAGAA